MRSFLDRLIYRVYGYRHGAGKPVSAAVLDREYASGAWDHFYGNDELPRFEALVDLIRGRPARPSLLELGCGSGRLLSLLPEGSISEYVGLDLSAEGLARARKVVFPGACFTQADFEEWRPDRNWDLILFNESIGYARCPAAIAHTFSAYLCPEGRLVISHFRFGNSREQWRQIEKNLMVETAVEVSNSRGQTWDIKVLRTLP